MPKQKTHSGAKKRFKVTGTGKLLRRHAMKSHLLEHKSPKRKRAFGKDHARQGDAPRQQEAAGGEVDADASSDPSTRARSGARSSSRRRATGASRAAATATRRSRSSTRSSTPTATGRPRSGRSGGSGSCASTPPRARTGSRTTSSSPAAKAGIELDRKVLADLAVSDPAAFRPSPSRRRRRSRVVQGRERL